MYISRHTVLQKQRTTSIRSHDYRASTSITKKSLQYHQSRPFLSQRVGSGDKTRTHWLLIYTPPQSPQAKCLLRKIQIRAKIYTLLSFTLTIITDTDDFGPLLNDELILLSNSSLNQDICYNLEINGDTIQETNETFLVLIITDNLNDAIQGTNLVTVTILDDDNCGKGKIRQKAIHSLRLCSFFVSKGG